MATITKRKIILSVVRDKLDPVNLIWAVKVRAYITDDTENAGEKWITVNSEPVTITRTLFESRTGQEIANLASTKATEILQALGSGSGGHTINDDLG